jgi:enoyl-CoA hydratase
MWQQLAENMAKIASTAASVASSFAVAGRRRFAAGGDLEEFVTGRATLEQALHYHDQVATALNAIADCPHPTVALIQGACIGGGLEIAGVCDLRISGESARFGAPINIARFLDVSRRNGRPAQAGRCCGDEGNPARRDAS